MELAASRPRSGPNDPHGQASKAGGDRVAVSRRGSAGGQGELVITENLAPNGSARVANLPTP
ncbi:hypothetical protein FHR33_008516 [Nonomuraea dietziae]|uniref:Uncharacterized protein n=1 Tax=Nonomuraea dietziae TaxID=65515 RepID=A0A7W5VD52_9ACTN|nr:hypothetical protein [Nonomuraea dietziae]